MMWGDGYGPMRDCCCHQRVDYDFFGTPVRSSYMECPACRRLPVGDIVPLSKQAEWVLTAIVLLSLLGAGLTVWYVVTHTPASPISTKTTPARHM